MKIRLALAGSLALVTAFAATSGAAPAEPHVVDAAGDANGLNGQGQADEELPGMATPVSSGDLDIVAVNYSTTKKNGAVHELIVELDLADAVTTKSSIYRVTANYDDCYLWAQYSIGTDSKSASIRTCDPASLTGKTTAITTFQTFEKKLRWTIPMSLLKGVSTPVKVGTTLTDLGAHTRLFLGAAGTGATVPQVDVARSDKTYKIG